MHEYNPSHDKYCNQFFKFQRGKGKPPKGIVMGPGRIRKRREDNSRDASMTRQSRRKSRKPKARGALRLARVTPQQVEDLMNEMSRLWDEHNIIKFHRDTVQG